MRGYLLNNEHRLHAVIEANDGSQTIVRSDFSLLSEAYLTGYASDNRLAGVAEALAALGISYDPEMLYGGL